MLSNVRLQVLVADDHPMYRDGVVSALRRRSEIEVVAAVDGGRAALESIRDLDPDVALLDIQMADLDGVSVAIAASQENLATRVVFLSGYYDRGIVHEALAAGAAGFLSKDATGKEIGDAVLAVARGETVLGGDIQAAVAEEFRRSSRGDRPVLSTREREVLQLVTEGLSAPEIAGRLHLGTTTVKTHLQHVYEKLGVTDRAAAVAEAMRQKLLP